MITIYAYILTSLWLYCLQHPVHTTTMLDVDYSLIDNATDTAAMNIDNTVNHALSNLWIENSTSADTVKALQLMSTHSLIDEKITAYTRMSVKQLKCTIHAEHLKDSLIQ